MIVEEPHKSPESRELSEVAIAFRKKEKIYDKLGNNVIRWKIFFNEALMTSIYTLEGKKKKPTFYTWDHRKNLPDQDACEVIKGSFKELFKKAGTKPKWHERSKIGLWFSTLFGSAAKKVLKRMEYTKFQQREKSAWYLRNKVALWFGTVFRNENVKKIRTSE